MGRGVRQRQLRRCMEGRMMLMRVADLRFRGAVDAVGAGVHRVVVTGLVRGGAVVEVVELRGETLVCPDVTLAPPPQSSAKYATAVTPRSTTGSSFATAARTGGTSSARSR